MLALLLGLFLCAPSAAADTCDTQVRYQALADSATALARTDDLEASLDVFAEAFAVAPPALWDAYRAARVSAQVGRTGRAFGYLHQAVEAGFALPGFAMLEDDLAPLRAHAEMWAEVVAAVHRENARRHPGTYDEALARTLTDVYVDDQRIRRVWQAAGRTHGFPLPDSIGVPIFAEMSRVDSVVLGRTVALLDANGWPGKSVVGSEGATAVFVVIQHSALEIQELYLPVMEAAVEAGEADAGNFVLLVDRVRVGKGLPQLYGTQYWYHPETGDLVYFPIESGIDDRLAALGLGSFREAVEAAGREWPVRTGWRGDLDE